MKLEVLKVFNDALEKRERKVGETFEVSAKRGAELLAHPMQLVKEVAAKDAEHETADKKPAVKRTKKKPAAKKVEQDG